MDESHSNQTLKIHSRETIVRNNQTNSNKTVSPLFFLFQKKDEREKRSRIDRVSPRSISPRGKRKEKRREGQLKSVETRFRRREREREENSNPIGELSPRNPVHQMSHEQSTSNACSRIHTRTCPRANLFLILSHPRKKRPPVHAAFTPVFIKLISFARLRSTPLGVFSKGCGGGGGEPFREYFMGMAV